jgi:hypothetical protein
VRVPAQPVGLEHEGLAGQRELEWHRLVCRLRLPLGGLQRLPDLGPHTAPGGKVQGVDARGEHNQRHYAASSSGH